ncbi:ABC transporter permease [Kitasatospora sp. NPDC094019]|uniref:ABC transporter permease n=1 Tax=Kitasatospora sp. NPDC094019 TaxID=3364091 RepID=UPI0037FFB95D
MTSTVPSTTVPGTTVPAVGAAVDGPRPRFRDLYAAEWIRFWSLRSMPWVLGTGLLVLVAVNLNAAHRSYLNTEPGGPPPGSDRIGAALNASFTVAAVDLLMLLAVGVGTAVVVAEYGSGMIRTTFSAVPDRRAVLLAKAGVLATAMLGLGTLAAGLSFWAAQALLDRRHAGVSIAEPGALRAVAAAALLAPVCALIGFGLGTLIRHAAASVVAGVLVLFLLPASFNENQAWSAAIAHAMPFTAWRRLSWADLTNVLLPPHPATVAGSWLAYAGWAVGAVLLAVTVVRRRDV